MIVLTPFLSLDRGMDCIGGFQQRPEVEKFEILEYESFSLDPFFSFFLSFLSSDWPVLRMRGIDFDSDLCQCKNRERALCVLCSRECKMECDPCYLFLVCTV